MSNDSGMHDPINISTGAITVEKSFVDDEFPVPAIKFVITSDSSDPVDLRLTDNVPESFPMDCVGFHPDYNNDHWTAYQDHRVEFVHTLEPNEELTTVYGIRLDEADVALEAFLGEPHLDLKSTNQSGGSRAQGIQDIVGDDNNEVVRQVLSGESDTVPGMEGTEEASADEESSDETAADPLDEEGVEAEDEDAADDVDEDQILDLDDPTADDEDDDVTATPEGDGHKPRAVDADTLPAVVQRPDDAAVLRRVDEEEAETDEPSFDEEIEMNLHESEADIEAPTDDDSTVDESPIEDVGSPSGTAEASAAGALASGGIAAALATEIREGRVDDDDLDLLQRELDFGLPNSVDVRIKRLQSKVGDLEAYSDALEEFIDEEGTGEEIINDLRSEVSSLSESIDSLESVVHAADADRRDLRDEVSSVEADVSEAEAQIASTADELAMVSDEVADLSTLPEDLDTLGETVDSLDTEMGDVRADVADLDSEVVSMRESLEDQLDELRSDLQEDVREDLEEFRAELERIQTDIEELDEFKDRLGSAFGGA